MKDNWKKLSVLLLALVMMMSMLAACGGGSSSSSDDDGGVGEAEEPVAAEPNSGVRGIVFSVPDDWKMYYAGEGIVGYTPNDKTHFWASTTTEDSLKEMKEYNEEIKAETVAEYYDEVLSNAEKLKETNTEISDTKIGNWEGQEVRSTNEAGELVEYGVRWLSDNTIYGIDVTCDDMYDEDGKFNKNASALEEDVVAKFESVLATIKEGDGETLKMSKVNANSIGEFTFEAPEGYHLDSFSDNYVGYVKDGSKLQMSINKTSEEDLKLYKDENGNAPQSLQEEYNNRLHEGVETTSIAGCEGYKFINNEYMDGKTYSCDAGFLADDAIYTLHFGGDAWDSEGNLKEDAESLSDDDKAAFEKFIESIKKK